MDPVQRTLGLLQGALTRAGLWCHVAREDGSAPGCFHFRCHDVAALHAALPGLGFTTPGPGPGRWESRQRRLRGSLHLKHFDGWPPDRVQAHVDPWGLAPPVAWWWLPFVPAAVAVFHACDPQGYLDLDRVEASLGVI